MKTRKKTLISLGGGMTLLALSLGGQAGDGIEPGVMIVGNTMMISAPATMDVVELNLEIMGPDDEISTITELDGSNINWSPGAGDSDGFYRYEVHAVAADKDGKEGAVTRANGEFRIEGSMMFDTEAERAAQDAADEATQAAEEAKQQSALNQDDSPGMRLAKAALELLVPAAQAADSTITDVSPQLNFVDTSPSNCGSFIQPGCPTDIQLEANSNSSFWMQEGTTGTFFFYNGGTNDISLQGSKFFFDNSTANLGIGTTIPGHELTIYDLSPGIRMDDSSSSAYDMEMELNSYEFALEGNNNQDVIEMDVRAPTHSLTVDSGGDVGIGTQNTPYDLHVVGNGVGTVEQLFRLQSSKPPQMTFLNSASAGTGLWYFAMTTDDQFKVSYDGTGEVEAKFFQNGNLDIAGVLNENSDRNAKTDIIEVDTKKVLDTVASLPISTWEYKDDQGVTHMGPMAQDFHEAFGLGSKPTSIATIDTGGVALAAIKGLNSNLNELVQTKDEEIASLKSELDAYKAELALNKAVLESNKEDISALRELVLGLASKEKVVMK